MESTDYEHILTEIQALSLPEQIRLLEKTAALLRNKATPPLRSIVELRGKGKGLWKSLDVEGYIETERASWDG